MEQYAVVNYDDRHNDDNEVKIKYVTDSFDYANKLAFYYAKKQLPSDTMFCRTKCKIVKNYDKYNSIYIHNVIVDYRICELKYDDENDKYDILDVYNSIWAVVKINIDIEKAEDINEEFIYKQNM